MSLGLVLSTTIKEDPHGFTPISQFLGFSLSMENGRKIKAIEEHLQLPEAIIQHIQSFLSPKEAALTALLSKSWYNSWLTHPILHFDERDFQNVEPPPRVNYRFLDFVRKRMESYIESNLGIESFKLQMSVGHIHSSTLATESIVQAVKLGVKNLNIANESPDKVYFLPNEVFESESLKMLSVSLCEIDEISGENVKCSKLEFLSLRGVSGGETIGNIISRCPLIENLILDSCDRPNIDLSKLVKLEKLSLIDQWYVLYKPMTYEGRYKSTKGCISNVPEFHKLKCLVLDNVTFYRKLFDDFSTKFPCIEDLTLQCCFGDLIFDISSQSVKYVNIGRCEISKVSFDFPNIRKFKFMSKEIPHFTVSRASCEWESDITIFGGCDISWFGELNKFLTHLSGSRISLNIRLPKDRVAWRLPDFHYSPEPLLENLTLDADYSLSVCSAFLDTVFWHLRPKFITQRLFPILNKELSKAINTTLGIRPQKANNKLLLFLCKKVMDLGNGNGCSSSGTIVCCKEVNAESFDDTFKDWVPLPWESLLDDVKIQEKDMQIRFRLTWAPADVTPPNHDKPKKKQSNQQKFGRIA